MRKLYTTLNDMKLTIDQALQQAIEAHKAGQLQDAERLYRAILQAQPQHPDANHNLGVLAVSVNKAEVALPLFKTALEADPSQGQFWLSYIDALIKEKNFDNARKVLSQGKEKGLAGEKVDALEAQLTTNLLLTGYEMASPNQINFNQARVPPQVEVNTLLEHYEKGRYDIAENIAKEITHKYPDDQFGWIVLGALFGQAGRLQDSLIANKRALEISPNNAELNNNLGSTLNQLGRLEDAVASYNKAISIKPEFALAHNNLGKTLQQLGRLEDAEASYNKAVGIKPDFAEGHYGLGNTLKKLGRLQDAEASYNKAIGIKPDFEQAHNNLGNTLQELGRLEEADASFKKAILINPEYVHALNNHSLNLLYLDELNEVTQVLLKLIAIDPEGYGLDACVTMAILNFLSGDPSSSKSLLLKSKNIVKKEDTGFVDYWNILATHLDSQRIGIQEGIEYFEIQNLYVIGESHSLASHGIYVKVAQNNYLCQSFWIMGCKAWHLGNTLENKYKHKFQKIIQRIPSSSNILLSVGEIDSRLDDGILNHIKKHPFKDESELLNLTINDYLKYAFKLLKPLDHNVTIQGVQCPNINLNNTNKEEVTSLINFIIEFNIILKKRSHFFGFNFLDLHKLTNRGDGFSNGKWHIDQYHLSSAGMQEAWRTHYLPYSA
jgi:tetratricopeptide (TPR) repeat protein